MAFVEHSVANPAHYHLMFQRTLPGVLGVLVDRLAAVGITDPDEIAIVRSVMSGVVAEQIADDPGGRQFADQAGRVVGYIVEAILSDQRVLAKPKRRTRTSA